MGEGEGGLCSSSLTLLRPLFSSLYRACRGGVSSFVHGASKFQLVFSTASIRGAVTLTDQSHHHVFEPRAWPISAQRDGPTPASQFARRSSLV